MPYIEQNKRKKLNAVLNLMEECSVKADGDLNYLLFTYCKYIIPKSYNSLKNYCGELRQCATEIERRILAEYEKEKIKENGDIYIKTREKTVIPHIQYSTLLFYNQENCLLKTKHIKNKDVFSILKTYKKVNYKNKKYAIVNANLKYDKYMNAIYIIELCELEEINKE
jgi:hypothetical protein